MNEKVSPFKIRHLVLPLLLLLILGLLGSGCAITAVVSFLYDEEYAGDMSGREVGDDPKMVTYSESQLVLAWDPPPSAVDTYKLLFRYHDTTEWFLIDQFDAGPDPEYTIYHPTDLDNGIYDFGVKAVDEEFEESLLHFSLETTADPSTGWYLVWER